MKYKIFILTLIFAFLQFKSFSQTTYLSKRLTVKKTFTKKLSDIVVDYKISLQNLEAPFEGNDSYRYYLQELKKEIAKRYPAKKQFSTSRISGDSKVDTPLVEMAFQGNKYNYSVPNDNTLAVSKSGIVLSAINTNLIFYDTKNDSLLKTISLNVFSDTLTAISSHQYDPKVIYDYQSDRFIVVNLSGASSDASSHIVVGFQKGADVLGEWSFYAFEGNPLNDTSWTDFPAISLTNDELFITGNLLRYGGSWQTSFKQSVIWQIDKHAGFNGDTAVGAKIYSDIKFNGVNVRNIHPVMGGDGFFGPEMYFMSNKNFSIQNDTFFLMKTTGLLSATSTKLKVNLIKSNQKYGAPPNPKMPANKRLATNDARVLGAIYQNGVLQFVGNTLDASSGFATFYHGLITNPDTATIAKLILYKSDSLQFGYPNISYCGTNSESLHSFITFNYTADSINPGFAAIFFEKEGSYSPLKVLKEGETYMNVLFGTLQRWGDYSGSQPAYGEPGKVWVCGTYGKLNPGQRVYGTWISKIASTTKDPSFQPPLTGYGKVYPNPTTESYFNLVFEVPSDIKITVEVIDINGRIITLMQDYAAKNGRNQLKFSTLPLAHGTYFLRISSRGIVFHTEQFVVLN